MYGSLTCRVLCSYLVSLVFGEQGLDTLEISSVVVSTDQQFLLLDPLNRIIRVSHKRVHLSRSSQRLAQTAYR